VINYWFVKGGNSVDVTLVCDIMFDLDGSIRPAVYLADELTAIGYRVSMMSPYMSGAVEERLRVKGITPINLRVKLIAKNSGLSLLWLETWAREAFLRLNSRHVRNEFSVIINFSHVISAPSLVWYLQGPPSVALKDMERGFSAGFRVAYSVLKPVIEYADGRMVNRMGKLSEFAIANSKFCASMYSKFGIRVDSVIYPPIDCQTFNPSTLNPSSDYVLAYFGKETKFSDVKRIAGLGIKIKAFGSKMPLFHKSLKKHPNIEFLGRVTTKELVEAYSNALFTLFPFTHEPFGYVPLESMACGTPVLTYNLQGPSEYVIDERTGWLVRTEDELVQKAVELWKEGYPSHVRANCRRESLKFDKKFYVEKWLKMLDGLCEIRSCDALQSIRMI
jgi:glycosyltransferase involved in cell wall biosynthesis